MSPRPFSRWLRCGVTIAVTVTLLVVTAQLVGTQALLAGGAALTPWTVAAALGAGLVTALAQGLRWWLMASRQGIELTYGRAVADCYASSLGNMVLPGGLGGDAARIVVYRDDGARRWWSGIVALGAERLTSTTLLFAAAAVVLAPLSGVLASIAGAAAVAVLIAAVACMRGVPPARHLLVWSASALGFCALLGLYLTAMAVLGGAVHPALAVIGLTAMSLPVSVGGWGVREFSAGAVAVHLAVSAEWAVTVSTGYGLLATISTLPGVLVLVVAYWRRGGFRRRRPPFPPPSDAAPSPAARHR